VTSTPASPAALAADIEAALEHPGVGLGSVRIGPGVRAGVADPIPAGARVALLRDTVPYADVDGGDVKAEVAALLRERAQVSEVVLEGDVHADEETVAAAVEGCADADWVVTVGSGTLSDIGKVAAGERPHVIVQSAASVNGFADDQSVLLKSGVKRTVLSAWPRALYVDSEVLAGAPAKLNRSGLGDMVSMFTAPADWYLSSLVGLDGGWNADAAVMTRRYGDDLLGLAGGVGSSDPVALERLAEFLTLSGLSMGVAGQTSPSSGMEHTVSHMLDMAHGARGERTALHGSQVGVATVLVAIAWRRVLERIDAGAEINVPGEEDAERAVRGAFERLDPSGKMGQECWDAYSKKLARLRSPGAVDALRAALTADWTEHRGRLEGLLERPERIAGALAEAGAPLRFSALDRPAGEDDVRWALLNCHLMRDRFTVADLSFLIGAWTAEDVEATLAEAEALGVGA
jgi:glycerol-1-phosphate dehydrogenase [NAD(P)+]